MQITKLIIHEVRRLVDAGPLNIVMRPSINDIKRLSSELADSLIKLFVKASLNIGGFGVNGDHEALPQLEQQLLAYKKLNTQEAFVEFTHQVANSFATILSSPTKQMVKGGYLVLYEYNYLNQDWLAIVILNKTEGIDVNESLDAIAIQLLDLTKLHIGATINLTKWQAADGERYIKFKTGLASEIRDYFENLVGCLRDQQAIKVETQQLRDAIENFSHSQGLNIEEINSILNEAYSFIRPLVNESRPVLLTELVNSIFPDKVDSFFEYVNENDIDLSEDISVDNNTLKTFKRFSVRWNDINLTFNRNAIGSSITLDNGRIILNNAPPSIIEDIEKVLHPNDKK